MLIFIYNKYIKILIYFIIKIMFIKRLINIYILLFILTNLIILGSPGKLYPESEILKFEKIQNESIIKSNNLVRLNEYTDSKGKLVNTSNIATNKNDKYFLPILITSVIIVSILVFAMWQNFKIKRHY